MATFGYILQTMTIKCDQMDLSEQIVYSHMVLLWKIGSLKPAVPSLSLLHSLLTKRVLQPITWRSTTMLNCYKPRVSSLFKAGGLSQQNMQKFLSRTATPTGNLEGKCVRSWVWLATIAPTGNIMSMANSSHLGLQVKGQRKSIKVRTMGVRV